MMRNFKYWILVFIVLITAMSGCRHKDEPNSESGDISIALTDAAGDFLRYSVDVTQLTLTKANGTVVNTIPESTRVDFAQYVDMTEFLTAATVPAGVYTHATITLDYTNADIVVEDETGNSKTVSSIVDRNGATITTLDVSVQLNDRNRLLIARGVPRMLTLDFDLETSNQVEFEGDVAKVIVDPILVASLGLNNDKALRVRGLLTDTDTASNTFTLAMQPFHRRLSTAGARFGEKTITTNNTTAFEIDGNSYTGDEGLAALAIVTKLNPVIVKGAWNITERTFVAQEVYAGLSVAGTSSEFITGNIVKRVGNSLTVRGALLERAEGAISFHDTVTVELNSTTKVTRASKPSDALTIDDIVVGQRITIGGIYNDSTDTIDANFARLHFTMIQGSVAQVDNDIAVLELHTIDRRPIAMFDFTGTGASATQFEVSLGNLSSTLKAGDEARVIGFPVNNTTGTPDFNAITVIQRSELRAALAIAWANGTSTPFASTTADSVQLNMNDLGLVHHIVRNGVRTDLNTLGINPTISVTSSQFVPLVIKENRIVTLHSDFTNFITDIEKRIAAGSKTRGITATGNFTASTATMEAAGVHVFLD